MSTLKFGKMELLPWEQDFEGCLVRKSSSGDLSFGFVKIVLYKHNVTYWDELGFLNNMRDAINIESNTIMEEQNKIDQFLTRMNLLLPFA